MRNFRLRSATFVGLLAWAIISPARAHDFSEYALASQRFSQLVAEAALQRSMPRFSDPAAAALLRTLSDHRRFLGTAPFTNEVMGDLMDMCEKANRTAASYVLSDLDKYVNQSMKDPDKIARIVFELGSRNAVKYQEEITPLMAFNFRCMAKGLPLIAAFAAALPAKEFTAVRRQGLAQLRNGVSNVFIGVARTATETAISARNRRELFAVMTEFAPLYAQVMDLDSRRKTSKYFDSMAGSMPAEFASQFRQISKELSAVNCEGLCRL